MRYHLVSEAYDFTSSGIGVYSFQAKNLFYSVHPSTLTVVPIYAHNAAHNVSISGELAIARERPVLAHELKKRNFVGCDLVQQVLLEDAAKQSVAYLRNAVRFVYDSSLDQY